MGDLVLIRRKGGGNGNGRDGDGTKPPDNPSPKRPQKPFTRNRDIKPFIEVPGIDSGLMELIDLPIPIPMLRREIKRQEAKNPIEKEIDLMRRYKEKPLLFWRDELGVPIDIWINDKPPKDWRPGDPVPIWSKQRDIINALVTHRKVAVKSGHGVGKTWLAAGITLYLAYVWHATGMTTAPTFRQVRRALWGEIHYQYNRARVPLGGKINQVSLDLGDKWFVEGFATDKPMENITGIHEENIFVVVDEAGGVAHSTFEALDALLTSENTFVLYIGNPVDPTSPFADVFKPGSGFKQFTLSCYDSPNVRHDRVIYPKLTVKKWVDDKVKKWGPESNLFRVRVLGEFPQESKDTLIPIRYIEKALERGVEKELPADYIYAFGLDVARQGSDSTTFGIRYKSGLFKLHESTQKKRETETAGKMISIYNEFIPEFKFKDLNALDKKLKQDGEEEDRENAFFPPINVDDIGVGGGVVDILTEEGFPVNGVNVAEQPDSSDMEEAKLFLNKRAQYYWNLKKLFEAGLVAIEDEELGFELSKMRIEFLRSGKIKIVDKDTIKKDLGGRSPDKAECMMLAFSMDYADVERELVRFL
jgi:hypothetical protein